MEIESTYGMTLGCREHKIDLSKTHRCLTLVSKVRELIDPVTG